MKKLIALFLCLLLIGSMLVLSACDDTTIPTDDQQTTDNSTQTPDNKDTAPKGIATLNGKTPEELYDAAVAKLATLTNYEMTSTQLITMSYGGQQMPINQVVVAKVNGLEQYIKSTNDMEESGNMEMWYINEWMYVIANNVHNKANITHDIMAEYYLPEGSTGDSALMSFPKEWFKDIQFFQDGEAYYIEFVVSGEEYCQYMKSTSLGDLVQGVTDISYKVYFDKDGNLGDIVTEFDYVVQNINCHLKATSSISNIGNVVIEAPANPDSFVDVTASMPHN